MNVGLTGPPSGEDFALWVLVHVVGAPAALIAAVSYALWMRAWWSAGRDAARRVDAVVDHVSNSLARSRSRFVGHLVIQVLFVVASWAGALLAEVTVTYLSVPQTRTRSLDELLETVVTSPGWTPNTAGAVVVAVTVVVIANIANARTAGGAWWLGALAVPAAVLGFLGGLLALLYMREQDFQGVAALGASWLVIVVAWCALLNGTTRDWRDYYPPPAERR